MTLILAANLSDRILLVSDTLVTKENKNGTRDIVCYYPKLQQFANVENGKPVRFVAALFAGDLYFARFIAKKLAGAVDANTLPADITELRKTILDYLSKEIPAFNGRRKATFILAGTAYDGSLRIYDFERLHEIIGPFAGHIDDPVAVQALQVATQIGGLEKWKGKIPIMLPRQEMFQVKIDERNNIFEVSDAFGSFNVLLAGSRDLSNDEKNQLLKYFLSKRPIETEGIDIVNFIRNQFSSSIGGGVMLGIIESNKRSGGMSNLEYEVKRDPANPKPKNWSFHMESGRPIIIDPVGKKIDLLQSHFADNDCVGDATLDL